MIKLNLQGGETLEFNLRREEDLNQWLEWSSVEEFQKKITGIGIMHDKKFHTLPIPKGFRRIWFYAKLVKNKYKGIERIAGEKIYCYADGVYIELMVYTYKSPPIASKVTLQKLVWKQRGPSFKDMRGHRNGKSN